MNASENFFRTRHSVTTCLTGGTIEGGEEDKGEGESL